MNWKFPEVQTVLVDRRNIAQLLPEIITAISGSSFIGFDIETHDDDRHEGLNRMMKVDDETRKKAANKRLVFDNQRTTVTGFSLWVENHPTAWYFNLAHADVDNRIPWDVARTVLRAKPEKAFFVSHNAPYELTMMGNSLGFEIPDIICTLQMCVSCYGSDEFLWERFLMADLGEIGKLIPGLRRASIKYDSSEERQFVGELAELAGKITAKESDAAWSYNGWVDQISWGYDLKKAIRQHFGHQMSTFAETLGENAHMGQLTGEQVAAYGAEDSVAAVALFRKVLVQMASHSPNALKAFFETENPMIHAYADIWRKGLKLDLERVYERRAYEREEFAKQLRQLKAALLKALTEGGGFRAMPDARLLKHEKWYVTGCGKYRAEITRWATSPDEPDAFRQCQQVRSPVSNAWATETGNDESSGPNLVHYMRMRVILYDLLQLPLEFSQGKVQSDGESRGNLLVKAQKASLVEDGKDDPVGWKALAPIAAEVLKILTAMSGCEQRMKLYLTPYTHLIDPVTKRVYPTVSSMLDTRRIASSNPNPMQLAKRGESTYVRGFFEADYPDHVVLSRDWSGIELVIVGEESKDPEFHKAFGQLPHGDLHSGAAADIMAVEVPGLNETAFKGLKRAENWEHFIEQYGTTFDKSKIGRLQSNLKGELMTTSAAFKYWRTEIGKGANFNYWYSGFLATIGERMGWGLEQTGDATRRYAERFIKAEEWRRGVIQHGADHGWVELPDGHRRYRVEATEKWLYHWLRKWPLDDGPAFLGFNGVVHEIARKIQKRAHNQLVNAMVQGLCAALMKRTILRFRAAFKARGWTDREARIMIPIHDELVFSVHRELVHEFLELSRDIMADHKDLFPTLALDSSPAIGLNFEPWHPVKAPFGQVELYEPPKDIVGEKLADTRLDRDGVNLVLDYLFHQQTKAAA